MRSSNLSSIESLALYSKSVELHHASMFAHLSKFETAWKHLVASYIYPRIESYVNSSICYVFLSYEFYEQTSALYSTTFSLYIETTKYKYRSAKIKKL